MKIAAPSTITTTSTAALPSADYPLDNVLLADLRILLPSGMLTTEGSRDLLDGMIFVLLITPLEGVFDKVRQRVEGCVLGRFLGDNPSADADELPGAKCPTRAL